MERLVFYRKLLLKSRPFAVRGVSSLRYTKTGRAETKSAFLFSGFGKPGFTRESA